MRRALGRAAVFTIAALASGNYGQAGNEHDHLQYLPSYDDIYAASHGKIERVAFLELNSNAMSLPSLFGSDILDWLDRRKGNAAVDKDRVLRRFEGKTLREGSEIIAQYLGEKKGRTIAVEDVMRAFFEFAPVGQNSSRAYTAIHDIRTHLFQADSQLFADALKAYVQRTPIRQLRGLGITVPSASFESAVIPEFDAAARAKGVAPKYYRSVLRSQLIDFSARGDREIERVRDAIVAQSKSAYFDGVDFTGSLHEAKATYNPKLTEDQVRALSRRMASIMRAAGSKASTRLHLFEGANSGSFYDATWMALESLADAGKLPEELRIGHILELSDADIARFEKLKAKTRLVFEVNPSSNARLQAVGDAAWKKLTSTVTKLQARGHHVALGADGEGIFGFTSETLAQLERFKREGLSERGAQLIVEQSYARAMKEIPSSRLAPKAHAVLRAERDQVLSQLIPEKKISKGSGRCLTPNWADALRELFTPRVPAGLRAGS